MTTDRIIELSNGVSPLRDLTNKYKDSKKPNPSKFLMNEKLFLGKISLFGKEDLFFEKISNKFNITLPKSPNTTTKNDKITALWLSPKEWFLVVSSSIDVEEVKSLLKELIDVDALATDVSDRWIAINLTGNKTIDILSKGTTIDLDNFFFDTGACAQTTLWAVNVIIYKIDSKPSFDIFVDSTMATFLWQWLEHSSREYI